MNVKSLPAYNGDVKFSGLVGRFDIKAEMEADMLKVGDSTTLSIVMNGTGNIMDVEEPEISIPDEAFKIYKDNPEEDIRLNPRGYSGKKIFRVALVPVKEGNYELEPIRFSYFDISKGRYETRSTRPFSIRVNPSEEKNELEVFSAPFREAKSLKKKVEFTGRDILPLKEELDSLETRKPLSLFGFFLLLMVPALFFAGVKAAIRFNRKSDDPADIMAERAEKALKDACSGDVSAEECVSCIHRALISAVLSKAGVKGESLTYSEARNILRLEGYSQETAMQAAKLLEKIESAQYSGSGMDKGFRENLLSETKQLIRSLS